MVFNCGDIILDTLKSLDGRVDEIHCYDGAWDYVQIEMKKAKMNAADYSTDNTEVIIKQFALTSKSKVEYHKIQPHLREREARTKSIANIAEGDWVFVIDSDEKVIEWNDNIRFVLENENKDAYYFFEGGRRTIYLLKGNMGDGQFTFRFFKKVSGMRYSGADTINSPKQNIHTIEYKKHLTPIGIVISHQWSKRKTQPHARQLGHRPHPKPHP
jgi:glycosyltransferase involved in cell wall biosynthesis